MGTQLLAYIGHDGLDPNPILAAVYAGTHRTLFSLGMSWMILACTHGYGGKSNACCRKELILSELKSEITQKWAKP